MNKHRIQHRLHSLVTYCAFLAFLFPLPGLAGEKSVPLNLKGAGSFCQEGDDCSDIVAAFDFESFPAPDDTAFSSYGYDQGIGSHFGKYSVIYRIDFFANFDAEGYFILTTADGSGYIGRNFFIFTGFNEVGNGTWAVHVEFIHGLGRFEGVAGSADGNVESNLVDFIYDVEGTLDNPGRGRGRRR